MIKVDIKPLSVNDAWQGKRFKTKKYKGFEKEIAYKLPSLKIPEKPYKISIDFGFSNSLSDIDNPLKPFLDCLQRKYNINDRDVYMLTVEKTIVTKGNDYISFEIDTI